MDRGLNLEALTEEDDEGSWERSESESEDEGRNVEPNQFDNLCDGVHACMSLVHASLQEMLELKDELLRHSLPPSVLAKTALVTSKVFRSFSDLHVPVGELTRMVRLYSTPWEEKSTALKKLHDDYEGKKTQLNIAIKRLEMVDAYSKRIARERRVMNWEKLFAKVTAAKGHGRRWKFLIDAFKKRANLGMEHLQEYIDSMEVNSSDEEEEEEETEGEELTTQIQHTGTGSPSINQEEEEGEEEGEEDGHSSESEGSSDEEVEDKPIQEVEIVPQIEPAPTFVPVQKVEEVKKVVQIKPPMKDAEVWVDERVYDTQLYIRVYSPEGLESQELKCVLNLGDKISKTGLLDIQPEDEKEGKLPPVIEEEGASTSRTPSTPKRGRGRSLMGGRGGRSTTSPNRTPTLQMATLPENEEDDEQEPADKRYYEDCIFDLEEQTPEGHYVPPGSQRVTWPEHLRVAVHSGPQEEILAMATINMADLHSLGLPTIVLPPPVGDEFDPDRAVIEEMERAEKAAKASNPENVINEVERANNNTNDSRSAALNNSIDDGERRTDEPNVGPAIATPRGKDGVIDKGLSEVIGDRKAVEFPLYSIHSGRSDAVHTPCGQLPLLCFWVKRERPTHLSKITESESLNALVLDLTGIDLNVTTKEDLNKEMRDEALSTISFTPEIKEETVNREEYDRLISCHNEEMEMLQNDYEQRLQELMDTVEQLHESHIEMSAQLEMSVLAQSMVVPPEAAAAPPSPPAPAPAPAPAPPQHRPYSRSPATRSITPQRPVTQSPYDTKPFIPDIVNVPVNKQTGPSEPYVDSPSTIQPIQRMGKTLPKWGKGLPDDFFERLHHFNELSLQKKAELREQLVNQMRSDIEKKMASQYRLANPHEEGLFDALQDVSLPAVFLPSKSNNMQIYNPRANKYFHPTGATGARLGQPPSMIQLPPLPKSKMSVLNLFDVSQNFHRGGPDWLMQKYLSASAPQDDGISRQETTLLQNGVKEGARPPSQYQQRPPSKHEERVPQKVAQEEIVVARSTQPPPPASSLSHHPSPAPRAPSVKSGRQTNSGSKSRSVASFRHQQVSATSVRHQVTLPGSTTSTPAGRSPVKSGGSIRQQPSVMSAALDPSLAKSVSPVDYQAPRTATTMSTTPGMMRTPNPVGVQEVGIVGPVAPPQTLAEVPTPTF